MNDDQEIQRKQQDRWRMTKKPTKKTLIIMIHLGCVYTIGSREAEIP
jgi:hypothetical protein